MRACGGYGFSTRCQLPLFGDYWRLNIDAKLDGRDVIGRNCFKTNGSPTSNPQRVLPKPASPVATGTSVNYPAFYFR